MKNFKIIILVTLILIVTFGAFSPCLKNNFVNWDDDLYVTENTVIQDFSFHSVKKIFTSFFVGNYQPATILSYLFEYRFFKLNPFGYHLINLILHLLNCFFVFWLIYILTQRISVSSITAFLFALHPLHVESVAWISERKDVLYALFFLAAIVGYCYYLKGRKLKRYYYFSVVLFILALLSKSMAITLPLVLFLVAYFLSRKGNKHVFKDKISFFILSFIFGAIAVIGQYSTGAVRKENLFNFFDKIAIASYSIIFYLSKILLPVKLSCLYPYSGIKDVQPFLPHLVLLIVLLAAVIISGKYTKKIIFGSSFFLITILPVLQFIPIGGAIVADRYVYVASIGIFYIFAEGVLWLFNRKAKHLRFLQGLIFVALIVVLSVLASLTWKRCQTWSDSITLWNDVLGKYSNVATAYNNRGDAYKGQKNIQQAISDFDKAIEINPNFEEAYNNRGIAYKDQGNIQQAISDYSRAIKANPNVAIAYNNRGNAHISQGDIQQAISDYGRAIEINSNFEDAYNNRGNVYLGQGNIQQAISDLNRAIEINPNFEKAYNNRGDAHCQQGNLIQAISDYSRAIGINPDLKEARYNRGVTYYMIKEYDKAWLDVHKAEGLGYAINIEFLNALKKASGRSE